MPAFSDLRVRLFTDPVISQVCSPVETIDEALVELTTKMFVIMDQNRGIGLAAPQIGLPLQLAVMRLENNKTPLVMINPIITKAEGKKIKMTEGCLSAPQVRVPVKRYVSVEVEFTNIKGDPAKYQFTDYDARIVQHEIDHLRGICIVNAVPKILPFHDE